ncbi:ribosome biogenesis GTP-binding protein YihA/YsxC [Membranicola marinus]|uniref:Probable GTP-binding protein EngB n=1 Tax=Membranihabitans marinus TaxID=1227546 RepID=A0A953HRM5_9BACT|nr:ribosome biogenesis GTP-binding protein YihA/YsxC [Membranihabitans marinus]MBY5957021.1 ribosome biogenesis GTP-binding protein YihA/YsxC [Membranihabitans marinus]
MNYQINYHASYHKVEQCPEADRPEFAFIGRSNVGKSSLINSLFGRKELAYVSKQPGKTQSINYYKVDERFYVVDLPGFGYAKHSKKQRLSWDKMTKRYFLNRPNMACVFVLIDANIPLQAIDRAFINWLGEHHLPYVLIFTKSDKSKPREIKKNIENIKNELLKDWEYLPPQFVTSSVKGEGKDLVLDYLFNLADEMIDDERK